jgi:hypothetical protein
MENKSKIESERKDDFDINALWGILKYKGKYGKQAVVILLILSALIVTIIVLL